LTGILIIAQFFIIYPLPNPTHAKGTLKCTTDLPFGFFQFLFTHHHLHSSIRTAEQIPYSVGKKQSCNKKRLCYQSRYKQENTSAAWRSWLETSFRPMALRPRFSPGLPFSH
jgi:hypothetical protein